MDLLEDAAWRHAVGLVRAEDLPMIAAQALAGGVDSPSLRELAGLPRNGDQEVMADLLARTFAELGRTLPVRGLPSEVLATLQALLAGAAPVARALRAQIPYARVTGRCGCGCATVDLAVDRSAVGPAPAHGNPAADAWYAARGDAGVMIFTEDGYLSLLEIYSSAGEPIAAWPEPSFEER